MNTPLHSRALLRHIRFDEVFVLQGTPLMGAAFSIATISAAHIETLAVFLIGSILLVAHVFTLNDWADIAHGLKAPDPLVSSLRLFWFSIFLLIASLLVFALITSRVVVLGAIVAALGFFYSHPKLDFKGTPIASSFPHLVGGLFHFLLGYAVFHGVVIVISCGWAVARLRAVAVKQAQGLVFRPGRKQRRWGRPPVGRFPMLWKEIFEPGFRFSWLGRGITYSVGALFAVPVASAVVSTN